MTVATSPGVDVLRAPIPYLERPAVGEELFNYAFKPPEGVPMSNGKTIDHIVSISDIRAARDRAPFTLKNQGFKLVNFPAGKGVSDWTDELQVDVRIECLRLAHTLHDVIILIPTCFLIRLSAHAGRPSRLLWRKPDQRVDTTLH